MPKAPMSAEDIEKTREKILDTALDIIIEEGFNNLSVRKIASRVGITATTIYNYYTNKDELNLMIRMRGFGTLHERLIESATGLKDPEDRIGAMVRAFVEFGRTSPSYYDIMFNLHTPKYLDYVGSDIEPVARMEKDRALSCLGMFIEPIAAYLPGEGPDKDRFIQYQVVKFWADLHGLVTLCNSRLFHEVLDDVETFVDRRTHDLIEQIATLKQPKG